MSSPGRYVPDQRTLCAALDAVDLGMALVGSDHRVEYCNAAYGEYLGLAPDAVAGASIFGAGCPCESLAAYESDWDVSEMIAVSGEAPMGGVVEVIVRLVAPGADTRLVVVRKGMVRTISARRLTPEVVEDVAQFVTDLTGHPVDQGALGVAPLSILLLALADLDSLRLRYGDEVSEDALRQVAQALVLQKRKADITCRYGDGQFLVLAPDTPRYGAAILAERIRQSLTVLDLEVIDGPVPVTLLAYTAEYRPSMDGSIREAVVKASAMLSQRAARLSSSI
jgi:diguanylate cyclase (GGDEF)-like protein